jgi:WD40 repeat protein
LNQSYWLKYKHQAKHVQRDLSTKMDEFTENAEDVEVIYLDEEIDESVELQEVEYNNDQSEPVDVAKVTFTKHSKSVFCCDLSRDGQIAVTGGEDDNAYVWSTTDGSVVFECTGHKDSVTAVCFNHNDELLATGDMAGMLQVWSVKEKKLIWCYEGDDMEWLAWHPLTNILLCGSHSGEVYVWQVPQGNCKVLTSHGSACTCGKVLPDGKHLLAGYEDGYVKLWDLKAATVKWQFTDSQVNSLEINSDGSLCSWPPCNIILKKNDGKVVGKLVVEGEPEIEAHVFSSELNLLVTGSLSGQLCVWDLPRQAIRHQAKLDCGVTMLKLGLNGKVYIGTTSGVVYVCDVRTGGLVETFTGHKVDILSLCVSQDGLSVLTTSDDETAKVFVSQSTT